MTASVPLGPRFWGPKQKFRGPQDGKDEKNVSVERKHFNKVGDVQCTMKKILVV